MALFILCNNGSSSSLRIYTLALITLVFVCSFSYCSPSSSTSFGSPTDDIDNNVENFNIDHNLDSEEDHQYRLPVRSLSSSNHHHHVDAPQHAMLSKNRFLELLLKSALTQSRDHHQKVHLNDRRYVPQSFHAMRG